MFKSLIGRISRWVRRTSDKYCTIELDKDARGLAKCLVHDPLTEKEKVEKYHGQLLQGIKDEDKKKVINHFNKLSKETDPLEKTKEIPDNSVKKVGIDISTEDVQARIKRTSGEKIDNISKQDAENAIRGLTRWPVSDHSSIDKKS